MRIRLVENDHHRLAEERAGQCDPLALPARERGSPRRHLKVVPAGQTQDHFVRSGLRRRTYHGLRVGIGVEPGDIDCRNSRSVFDVTA